MGSLTNGLGNSSPSIPYRARYKACFHGSQAELKNTLSNLVKKINVLEGECCFHSFTQCCPGQIEPHDECNVTLRADPLLSLRIYWPEEAQDGIEVTFDVDSMVPIETSIDHLFFEPAKILLPTIKSIYDFLGEPKVTVHKANRPSDILENNQWLRDHRQEYSGQWVALKDGKLLASANSAKELLHQVNATEDTLLTAVY